MLAALVHRGPDDQGMFSDERVTLGHRRLSIIDTSRAGHQPMACADGTIQIVFNGEIYNFKSERDALVARGRSFHTRTDTEVILALYETYGIAFLSRLRGIFALAIYDRRGGPKREKLLLARDHFGVKPLLYSERSGTILFASELKALLASGLVSKEVSCGALRQLLSLGSVYQPDTLVAGVKALPSAHYLLADRNGTRIERYWGYKNDRIAGLRQKSYQDQVAAFREALKESVRLQMVADVPVGAFLSGGVDSSLIVALMAQIAGGRVKTFSVGFEQGANAIDESHEAAIVARHLATDHTRVLVGSQEAVAHLHQFVRGLDQPSVDGFNSYFVSYAASQAVTVSLSGTGSDEIFLGYPWFAHMRARFGDSPIAPPKSGTQSWLFRLFSGASSHESDDDSVSEFRQAFGGLYHCYGPDWADKLLAPERRAGSPYRRFDQDLAACDELRSGAVLDRAGVLCLNSYTRNQLLRDIDACSMTHSLEVRVPFMDPVIADFALSLPISAKLNANERTLDPNASYDESGVKRIVCDVARKYLPAGLFSQRSKKGFSLPFEDWLRGPLAGLMSDMLSRDATIASGLFDPDAVGQVRQEFLAGRRPWSHPWLLMITEMWMRDVVRASASANTPPAYHATA
jgi:asparagine synthase (glutamine-hydrolysing)